MKRLPRPCLTCGRRTRNGTRCTSCAPIKERQRQARQWYRFAYNTEAYRTNRKIAIRKAGGRCIREVDGERCSYPAQETDHRIPLSSARSPQEALALCHWTNLDPVCWRHNPRGGQPAPMRGA